MLPQLACFSPFVPGQLIQRPIYSILSLSLSLSPSAQCPHFLFFGQDHLRFKVVHEAYSNKAPTSASTTRCGIAPQTSCRRTRTLGRKGERSGEGTLRHQRQETASGRRLLSNLRRCYFCKTHLIQPVLTKYSALPSIDGVPFRALSDFSTISKSKGRHNLYSRENLSLGIQKFCPVIKRWMKAALRRT